MPDRLGDDDFSYRVSQDGKVFIAWHGQQVMTLRGPQASRLLERLVDANARQVQLALAKVTGNFKHGNER